MEPATRWLFVDPALVAKTALFVQPDGGVFVLDVMVRVVLLPVPTTMTSEESPANPAVTAGGVKALPSAVVAAVAEAASKARVAPAFGAIAMTAVTQVLAELNVRVGAVSPLCNTRQ
jgi:hypothetical protein